MAYQTIGTGASIGSTSGAITTTQEQEATEVDYIDSSVTYVGKAVPGAALSAPLWKIQKIVSNGNDVSILWASGNSSSDKIWDDRLLYTYS